MQFKRFLTAILFFVLAGLIITNNEAKAQKVAFIASDIIRQYLPEAKQGDQRLNSIVDEWKRELDVMDQNISILENDIKKNRLVWTDEEKQDKEKELEAIRRDRLVFAKNKFESNGEYDKTVTEIMKPIEEKIYAAVQEVAVEEGFDIVFDKSVQPLPYCNFKYDLTVKVLRKLGVDVASLEKEQQEKINKDPRNAKKESKEAPGKRTKARDGAPEKTKEDQMIEREPTIVIPPLKPLVDPNNPPK
ncbi:MAG: OmpH family outer membrane protein [Bacteroidota bacterium]